MANILVVDDEPDVLEALARALRLAGHSVERASNAEQALALAKEHTFDLVVLDYIMPSMSGIALLNRLRGIHPTIRSIIVSGKIDSQVSEEALLIELRESIEADSYLHKPVENQKLVETIDKLLRGSEEYEWRQVAERSLHAKKRATVVKSAERSLNQHRGKKEK